MRVRTHIRTQSEHEQNTQPKSVSFLKQYETRYIDYIYSSCYIDSSVVKLNISVFNLGIESG